MSTGPPCCEGFGRCGSNPIGLLSSLCPWQHRGQQRHCRSPRKSPMHMYSMHSHVAVRCCDSAHAMRMGSIWRCKHEHAPREAQGAPRDAAGTRRALHAEAVPHLIDEHVRLVCYTAGTLSQHKVSLACHTRLLLRRTA
jgi:hypothetical protein